MNKTIIAVVVIVVIVAVGGYFYLGQNGEEATTAAGGSAAGAVTAVSEATQAAIDFCKEKGGTVETVTAAEGTTHLCAMADGTKAEVSQYMADNK